jgi:hypothetical protein
MALYSLLTAYDTELGRVLCLVVSQNLSIRRTSNILTYDISFRLYLRMLSRVAVSIWKTFMYPSVGAIGAEVRAYARQSGAVKAQMVF